MQGQRIHQPPGGLVVEATDQVPSAAARRAVLTRRAGLEGHRGAGLPGRVDGPKGVVLRRADGEGITATGEATGGRHDARGHCIGVETGARNAVEWRRIIADDRRSFAQLLDFIPSGARRETRRRVDGSSVAPVDGLAGDRVEESPHVVAEWR